MKTFNPFIVLKDTAVQLGKSTVYLVKNLWAILAALVFAGLFLKGVWAFAFVPLLAVLLAHITEYTLEGKIKSTPLFGFRWRKIETHFLVYTLILFGTLVLLNSLPLFMALQFSADAGAAIIIGVPILAILATLIVLSRLFLVFPLIIKRGTIGIKESWKATTDIWYKTFFLTALFCGAVVGLIIFVKSPYVETLMAIFQAMLATNVYKKIK